RIARTGTAWPDFAFQKEGRGKRNARYDGTEPLPQTAVRRTEARVRIVPELRDERIAFQHGLHEPALDATAAAVNQAKFAEPGRMSLLQKRLDHRGDVVRSERM